MAAPTPTLLYSGTAGGTDHITTSTLSYTAGTYLLIAAGERDGNNHASDTFTVSDTLVGTGTWTTKTTIQFANSATCGVVVGIAKAGTPGGVILPSVTVTLPGNRDNLFLHVYQINGIDLNSPFLEVETPSASAGTTLTAVMGQPPGYSLFAAVVARTNTAFTVPTGLTEGHQDSGPTNGQIESLYSGYWDSSINWTGLAGTNYVGVATVLRPSTTNTDSIQSFGRWRRNEPLVAMYGSSNTSTTSSGSNLLLMGMG